ncbi:MAG: ATP synthase F1 subunit delta [Oligoflexia bacterium]|nr:ATP synthase F1 subunit delta [Oligoflexia bacterium]
MKFIETSQRYAKAILAIAKEKNHVDSVLQQMELITKQFQKDKDAFYFMTTPVMKVQNQKEALSKIFESHPLREEVQNLLFLLVEKKRFFLLPTIYKELQREIDFINQVERGVVKSSTALSAGEQKNLENAISQYTGKKTQLEFKEDASVMGGVVARVGSFTFDDSLQTQIHLMQESLLKKEYLLNGNQS